MSHWIYQTNGDNASYKQWTTSSGTNHSALIDETILAKNTSDYVYSGTPPKRDQYSATLSPEIGDNIHTMHLLIYCNTDNITAYPGLTIRLYLGAVQLYTKDWCVDTNGAWQVLRFECTGLDISPEDLSDVQVCLISFDAVGNEPVPIVV